ncbi:MAG: hypothetical protein KW793_04180 [Candidatus Doudnabacteria bacterium]|nr:hypothetical protein [Candidatus Doudnabacteria bacterium]
MSSESHVTTDHDHIKNWAEERDGQPAVVQGTESGNSALLRIDFGEKEANLKPISWSKFFQIFDKNNLKFLHSDNETESGKSRFFKFVYQ